VIARRFPVTARNQIVIARRLLITARNQIGTVQCIDAMYFQGLPIPAKILKKPQLKINFL